MHKQTTRRRRSTARPKPSPAPAPHPETVASPETVSPAVDPPVDPEEAERRAVVLRNGVTWDSFERFMEVFKKWY